MVLSDKVWTAVVHFTSAAVAVDSSHMTALSALWSRFSPPSNFVNGHVSIMWSMVCCWSHHRKVIGRDPICAGLHNMGLTCLEAVQQGPCMMREIETWLSDSRVGYNTLVDHRSRRPVLSPLRNCVVKQSHCYCHTVIALKVSCFSVYFHGRQKPSGYRTVHAYITECLVCGRTTVISCHFSSQFRPVRAPGQ